MSDICGRKKMGEYNMLQCYRNKGHNGECVYGLENKDATIARLEKREGKLARALAEIREVYAGMEGFVPETCPEGYQQRLLKRMYDIAVEALKIDEGKP